MRRIALFVVPAVALVGLLAALVFHDALATAAIRGVAASLGYSVTVARLDAGLSAIDAREVVVTNRAGEPVFDATRIALRFSLRDLFPGSRHRYGVNAFDLERPQLTLIHHADGSYNITLPATNRTTATPDTTPIDVRARIRDGSVVLIDRYIAPGHERRLHIVGFTVDGRIAPATHSSYRARFDIADAQGRHPVIGTGTFAPERGFDAQRWSAATLPIGPLIDFALTSHAVDLTAGDLDGLDARIYTFVDPDGRTQTHIGVRAQLRDGTLRIADLRSPVRNATGPIRAYDDGLTTTGISATLAGAPLRLRGGIFDLSAPQIRFALAGSGSLAALRTLTAGTQALPINGQFALAFRAIGSASAPLVLGTLQAPALRYGAYRIDGVNATVAVAGTRIDLLAAHAAFGPLTAAAAGSIDLGDRVQTNLIATVDGAGDGLPYVPQIVPGLQLDGIVHVRGSGTQLATSGIIAGDGRAGSVRALIALDGNGDGTIGPLAIERNDGASLYARVAIDRHGARAVGLASAHHFSLAFPAGAGTLDANLAAVVEDRRLTAAGGHVALTNMRIGNVTGTANADIAGRADGTQRASLRVRTSVGDLDGNGSFDGRDVAIDGRVRSSFERLRALGGNLDAHGTIDVPLRVLGDGTTTVVGVSGARFTNASIHGVALRDADAIAVVRDGVADVRAARIGIDGGDVVARGSLGSTSRLTVVTSPLALHPLIGAATDGTLLAYALAHGTLRAPQAELGLAIAGATVHGLPLAAHASATYGNDELHIDDARALAGDAIATADGTVRDIVGGNPAIDVHAHLRGAQLAQLDRLVRTPLPYPDGELDVDARATGTIAAPQLTAEVQLPEGSVNELAFRNARAAVRADRAGIELDRGTITVGTTQATFAGRISRSAQRITLRAPHVDLTDFDNYFDVADAIAGRGGVTLDASASPTAVHTTGAIALSGVRVRRFDIGTTTARWTTVGRTINARAVIDGTHGTGVVIGAATLPVTAPLRDPAHRIALNAQATAGSVDLAAWLPAADIHVPVSGIVAATAHAHGAPATPAFDLTAAVTDGVAAGYHLDALTLTADGDTRRARLTALHLAGPGLAADASGTLGYGAHDPIAIALHAQSDDLPTLEHALGVKLTVAGSASTDVHVGGTRSAPQIAQTLDATGVRYAGYTIARVHGDASADAHTLRLNALEADLTTGRLTASASVPIVLAPPRIGVRDAPLTATIRAAGIGLEQFASFVPGNAKLTGTLDGQIVASGTTANPAIDGELALADGGFASNLVRSAVTNARARLTFTRSSAQLTDTHADIGGGTIDGSGTLAFGDLRALRRTLVINAQLSAARVGLDLSGYARGQVNGTLTLAKPARHREIVVGGTLAFSQTRIPLSALLSSSTPNATATPAALPIAFDLAVQAGNDVRVQGNGVDVGARGAVTVGGTLAKPTLDGSLQSTDGRLSLYRTFALQRGVVTFDPSDGVIPDVDATATTTISNPDTDILLHVTGPATSLNLDLASDPSYSKEQILGLLINAQAFGAVAGVQTSQSNGGINAATIAGGYLTSQLSQSLLEPFGSQLGSALGLSDLSLGYDYGSGFSAGASRAIGKNLTATVHQTFGVDDQRTILGLAYALKRNTSLQFSLFSAGLQSPRLGVLDTFLSQDTFTPPNYTLQALSPPPGVSGIVLTYQHKY
jgi:translocation and assembly module TamB